jgi:hypothetical protein
MSAGVKVSWTISMGTMTGVTVSAETADGRILVAIDDPSGISSVFCILVSKLTQL